MRETVFVMIESLISVMASSLDSIHPEMNVGASTEANPSRLERRVPPASPRRWQLRCNCPISNLTLILPP